MHALKGEAAAELRQSLHAHLSAELHNADFRRSAPAAVDLHGARAELEARLQGAQLEAQQAQRPSPGTTRGPSPGPDPGPDLSLWPWPWP